MLDIQIPVSSPYHLNIMSHVDLEFITTFRVNPCQKISSGRCCFNYKGVGKVILMGRGKVSKYLGYCILYQLCHAV
jgi:hypothetical protein